MKNLFTALTAAAALTACSSSAPETMPDQGENMENECAYNNPDGSQALATILSLAEGTVAKLLPIIQEGNMTSEIENGITVVDFRRVTNGNNEQATYRPDVPFFRYINDDDSSSYLETRFIDGYGTTSHYLSQEGTVNSVLYGLICPEVDGCGSIRKDTEHFPDQQTNEVSFFSIETDECDEAVEDVATIIAPAVAAAEERIAEGQ